VTAHAAHLGAALVTMLFAGACASFNVSSYHAPRVDTRVYRTYLWDLPENRATGDPRLDNNQVFDDYVRRTIETELARRGFERQSGPGRIDLLVHYHVNVAQKVDVGVLDRHYSPGLDAGQAVIVFDAGTLLIDFIDAQTKTLVWRGWAEGSLDPAIDDQRALEKRVSDAIARILDRLPPHRS
jgi:hypothetical protein